MQKKKKKKLPFQFLMLWENSSGHIRSHGGLSYTGVQRVILGKLALPLNLSLPPCIHLIKASWKTEGGERMWAPGSPAPHWLWPWPRDLLWLMGKQQAWHKQRFKTCLCTRACFLFCCAWEPCDHCYVNKPGLACCDKKYAAKSSLLPQLKLCQLSDM